MGRCLHPILPDICRSSRLSLANIHIMLKYINSCLHQNPILMFKLLFNLFHVKYHVIVILTWYSRKKQNNQNKYIRFSSKFILVCLYDLKRSPQDCLYSLRQMLVWLRGKNVIFGKFGAKMWFWKVLGPKYDFGKFRVLNYGVWSERIGFGLNGFEIGLW